MATCGRCLTENPETSRFCGSCASPLTGSPASLVATEAALTVSAYIRPRPSTHSSHSSSVSSEDGRFVPGTLVGDRFRVISKLGEGGMGEVYRATDLRLGQPVALKFLPEETARDPRALARFHNEVRIARQVAHPNVCRVYDIGEVAGLPYISMEYVDGEDLHSLLRRIGRLPSDKALEIARKLCAGLAAAHDKGVLHRDLKPANIMIDGRGNVLITDFGLAGIIGEIEGIEARNGTPGYMAPEQLTGKEVSARSDIYALGVVLYEMFTGKRPFIASSRAELLRMTEEGMPPAPRTIVKDIDPAVESLILRCLSPDPQSRPATPISVLAALPGGDPLAAALAAGETPSPEMVAASGEKTGLKPAIAASWMAATIVLLILFVVLNQRTSTFGKIPLDKPPDVLVERARQIAQTLGYPDRPASAARGFEYRLGMLNYVINKYKNSPWTHVANGRPPAMAFWYRTSPQDLVPREVSEVPRVTFQDPPEIVPGMWHVVLDPQGRLLNFLAIPPDFDEGKGPWPQPDWNAVFAAAGLDRARFQPVDANWAPPVMADSRAAWKGTYSEEPEISILVEVASYHGRPVSFAEVFNMVPADAGGPGHPGGLVYLTLQLIVLIGSFPIARYNLRAGRGDTKGAIRLGLFVSAVCFGSWLIGGSHVMGVGEADLFMKAAMRAVFGGVCLALTYLSLEPFVRRRWPQTIVSWSRVLTCGFRDPLVGRDVLYGACIAIGISLVLVLGWMVDQATGRPTLHAPSELNALLGGRYLTGQLLFTIVDTFNKGLGILFLMFLARMILRKQWLAGTVVIVTLAAMEAGSGGNLWIVWPVNLIFFGAMVLTLMRYGLVALITTLFVVIILGQFPISSDFTVWYFGEVALVLAVIAGIALFGFKTALAGELLVKSES